MKLKRLTYCLLFVLTLFFTSKVDAIKLFNPVLKEFVITELKKNSDIFENFCLVNGEKYILDLNTTVCALAEKNAVILYNPINSVEGEHEGHTSIVVRILNELSTSDILGCIANRSNITVNFKKVYSNISMCINSDTANFLFNNEFVNSPDDIDNECYYFFDRQRKGRGLEVRTLSL